MAPTAEYRVNSQKGSVTVEDVEDDYEDDDAHIAHAAGSATARSNGSGAGASSPANETRSDLSPAEEGAFDIWLRNNINKPLLSVLPEWVSPNFLSLLNTLACWFAFLLAYLAYKYEHVYPAGAVAMRVAMVACIWSSMVLDCLDGMQARKTGKTSKLGELLDHALDAANIPLCSAAALMTLMPDQYTVLISLIGGVMIYNAQLVIYRHQHVFVLPPVTGPVAQAMVCAAMLVFTLFFRLFDRHAYVPTLVVTLFAIGGNITQAQNTLFFGRRLLAFQCVAPHARFAATMILHGLMLPLGYFSVAEYLTSAALLAFRLNGRYVLDTLVGIRPFTSAHTREHVAREDANWRMECVLSILGLLAIGFATSRGASEEDAAAAAKAGSVLASWIGSGAFHLAHAAFMAMCVLLNLRDLRDKLPLLEAK